MNLKEYLGDGPKKMFSLLEGIVTVELIGLNIPYFFPYITSPNTNYKFDGTLETLMSRNRVLLTLEEAAQLGFVRRVGRRVKFLNLYDKVEVTERRYFDKEGFLAYCNLIGEYTSFAVDKAEYVECCSQIGKFISFVDENLNECSEQSMEWEETVPNWMRVKSL